MCVPIFFCINGALMLRKEYSYVYLIRKNLKLFILILTWGLLYSYVGSLTLHENIASFKDIYNQIGKPLKGDHLWYLEELFCLNIFNPLIYAYIKNKTQVHILLLSLVFTIFTLNIIVFKIPFSSLIITP
jgi:surface polysaccharide O-acyltransferase-like enzyme